MSRRLEVLLHQQLAGHLSELPDGGSEFRFADAYREAVPRPILGQKFEDGGLERIYRSRKAPGLPDFFANLIPEGRLREVIEQTAALEPGDDLALLTHVGRDLPGAVIVRPVAEPWEPSSLEPSAPPPDDTDADWAEVLRFSLAGVQLKFSMLREHEKLTLPATNQNGEWIVKFDSPTFPHLPENEYSMLEWARAAGFDVPACHLHAVDDIAGFPRRLATAGSKVLAIRRYDRSSEGRVHQEDFTQIVGLPPRKKYEHVTYEGLARLVRRLVDEPAVDELIRRLVFVVACGNNDAHLKNWSLIYPGKIQPRWSPLYDQVATIGWPTTDRKMALKFAGVWDFGSIDHAAFERLADRADIDRQHVLRQVHETLARVRAAWPGIRSDLPLPEGLAHKLREHWRRVPLLEAAGTLE